jgi:hypothetical protein
VESGNRVLTLITQAPSLLSNSAITTEIVTVQEESILMNRVLCISQWTKKLKKSRNKRRGKKGKQEEEEKKKKRFYQSLHVS